MHNFFSSLHQLAGKANEVRELRNLVTKALQQVSNDAIIAKRVDQRLEATKVGQCMVEDAGAVSGLGTHPTRR